MSQRETENKIQLKLSDIIKIIAPKNDILNEKIFLIDYIDASKLVIIGKDNLEEITLRIHDNGQLSDGSITEIELLKRNKQEGYARQNNLLPGTWVNITFNGENPFILIGEITNLEEDMIELQTYPDNDIIYIDFGYKGVPEDLPIQSIEIRNPPEERVPAKIQEEEERREKIQREGEEGEEGIGETFIQPNEADNVSVMDENENVEVPLGEIDWSDSSQSESSKKSKEGKEGKEGRQSNQKEEIWTEDEYWEVENKQPEIKQQLAEADEIIFGNYLDPVQEFNIIDKDKYRYDLQEQANDLLDNIISKLPTNKRTDTNLNLIHSMITRFLQLRTEYSVLDENGTIIGFIKKNADYKPLVEYLSTIQNTLNWIYYVTDTKKKIYEERLPENVPSDVFALSNAEAAFNLYNIFESYKSDEMEYDNNYAHLYNSIANEMIPFIQSDKPGLLSTEISKNLIGITNNLDNMFSTTYSELGIDKNNKSTPNALRESKFFVQQYNIGLTRLKADSFKGSHYHPKLIPMTSNDPITISSILTLPEPFVRYSKINLPQTNILNKANLNKIPFQLSFFLNQKQLYQDVDISNLEIDFDYEEGNFLNNVKKFNLQLEETSKLSPAELFRRYLDIVIPKNKVLFALTKKYITGTLSIVNILDYLEPFMIYSNDLTFKQYKIFNYFIYSKISEYNRKYILKSRFFNALSSHYTYKKSHQTLLHLFDSNKEVKRMVIKYYNFDASMVKNDDEVITTIVKVDQGRFFNECMSFINLPLLVAPGLMHQLTQTDQQLNNKKKQDVTNTKCQNSLSKIYHTQEELDNDNDKVIYFDPALDHTDYSVLNKYKKEQHSQDYNDFLRFLTEKMTLLYPDHKDPQYLAETLILGKKEIRDNDMAYNTFTQETYKRVENKWIKDNVNVGTLFDYNTLCLIKNSCVENNKMIKSIEPDACISVSLMKDQLLINDINTMLDNFDKNYQYGKTKLKQVIDKALTRLGTQADASQRFQFNSVIKYNIQQYNLGLELKDKERHEVSPYLPLLEKISSLEDFVQKQSFIIKFCEKFTRAFYPNTFNLIYNEEESKYWRYCVQTNTKLVPTFMLEIAESYFHDRDNLNHTIDEIISRQGKLSDDGDSWVDEHSGLVIKMINMVEEEEYDEGFKIKSRGLLEEDQYKVVETDVVIDSPENMNPLSKVIYMIISSLAANSFVNIDSKYPFIINTITSLILNPNVIEKEESYKERVKKSNKKMPSYELLFNSTLMYLTAGMFIISAQTSIPSIQPRRTFPGCVKSLTGFPLNGEGDLSTIIYFSCILFNIKTPEAPWNVLKSLNVESIGDKIKFFMNKHLLPLSDIQQLLASKNEYLQNNVLAHTIQEVNLSSWDNFRPPLKPVQIKTISPLADNYTSSIVSDIKRGNYKQEEKLLMLASKIILYSLEIVQFVQQVVSKKNMLLVSSNNPYLENACCNEENVLETTLEYFIKQKPEIGKNNELSAMIEKFLYEVVLFSKASMMLSIEDTKIRYPPLLNVVSDSVMFKTLIYYCNYRSLLPIPLNLIHFCKSKPAFLDIRDEVELQITKMKANSMSFSKQEFLKLIQLVSQQNSYYVNINRTTLSSLQLQRNFYTQFDPKYNSILPSQFVQLMKETLDSFDVNVTEVDLRDLRNYLETNNKMLKKDIEGFIKAQVKITKNEQGKIHTFLERLNTWNGKNVEDLDESSFYNFFQYCKNLICLFSKTLPKSILTKTIHKLSCPSYWGLSKKHTNELEKNVEDFYENYNKYFDSPALIPILQSVISSAHVIIKASFNLVSYFPFKQPDITQPLLFDKRTAGLLITYYLLRMFQTFIYVSSHSDQFLLSEMNVLPISSEEESLGEMFYGEKKVLKQVTAELLQSYIQTGIQIKKDIDVSSKDIEKMVFRLSQAEKNTYTERLEKYSQEKRDVENELKKNKLGTWNKGLQKGLRVYDPENYDQEREFMYNISRIERNIRQNGLTNNEDIDEVIEERMNELAIEQEIDADERNIRMLPEDYWDGDPTGEERDEYYDDNYDEY